MTAGYFVWVESMRGPVPEKWPEMLRNMNGALQPYLAKHELSDAQFGLPLRVLEEFFPPPLRRQE